MWKYIISYCLFIAICFMMPSFLIDFSKVNKGQTNIENELAESGDIMEDESENKMKLLLSESNKVVELSMNDYIKGVVLR